VNCRRATLGKALEQPLGIPSVVASNEQVSSRSRPFFQVDCRGRARGSFSLTEAIGLMYQQSATPSADTFIQQVSALFATANQGRIWARLFGIQTLTVAADQRMTLRTTSAQALRTVLRQESIPRPVSGKCQHRIGRSKRISQASASSRRRPCSTLNKRNDPVAAASMFRSSGRPSIRCAPWMRSRPRVFP